MATLRTATSVAFAASVLLAVPASAHAATLAVPPCSASLAGIETIPVQGAGFAPNTVVRLAADGQPLGTATADAAGAFQRTLFAPPFASVRRTEQTFSLTGTDDAGTVATTPLRVTRVGAKLPERARPARRVRMRVFGFVPGRVVYLHIRRGGRTRGTFKIGTTSGPCGTASRRLRYMPLRRYSSGNYTYEFQQAKRFDAKKPRVQLRISIFRRFG